MDLETLIVAVFCLVDDFVRDLCRHRRLRQRGPAPVLADSEVLTVEIVGEILGLDTDRGLPTHSRRHFGHLFPGLAGRAPHHVRAPGGEPVGGQARALAAARERWRGTTPG